MTPQHDVTVFPGNRGPLVGFALPDAQPGPAVSRVKSPSTHVGRPAGVGAFRVRCRHRQPLVTLVHPPPASREGKTAELENVHPIRSRGSSAAAPNLSRTYT